MSLPAFHSRYHRLQSEHAAWRLLRAANAPLIMAFITELFREENEVPFGRARVVLQSELDRLADDGREVEKGAGAYLREWSQAGWLRELDDQLTATDACDVALRFCQNLEQREVNASASHLRIVQDAVTQLAVDLSPNPQERITLLEHKKAALQREIDQLLGGVMHELSAVEERERIREVYQLASVLTGDFRRVEDDIRGLDQRLRVQMIESGGRRGDVILALLEQEQMLADSDAGRAFDSFFQLLCDQNRSVEFREQLRSILGRSAAEHLSTEEARFLGHLVRELTRESQRVFQVRRRTEESLRSYIESGAHMENLAVENLLRQLEQIAVRFNESDLSFDRAIPLTLSSGSVKIGSIDSICLRVPEEQLDIHNIQVQGNSSDPSSAMLDCLQSVKMIEVAARMRDTLHHNGPLTVAGMIQQHAVEAGLEELVAYLRVAKNVGAALLEEKEQVTVKDRSGIHIQAAIPCYQLSVEMFPEDLTEVAV